MANETSVYDIARSLETEKERLNNTDLDDSVKKTLNNFVNYIRPLGLLGTGNTFIW